MSTAVDTHVEIDPTRRPGRPRDLRTGRAILDATLELLIRDGINGLSLSAVATRAGVGKATIYRWWSGKDDLVVDALATLTQVESPRRTGELRADLVSAMEVVLAGMSHTLAGQVLPRVMGEASPQVQALYWERVIIPQRQSLLDILAEGMAAGELRQLDPHIVIDMMVGPLVIRHCLSGVPRCGSGQLGDIVDLVLEGVRRS